MVSTISGSDIATPKINVDSGTLFVDDVNDRVGIGTSTPSIQLALGDSDTGLQQQGDGELAVYTNNVEHMRINSSGNVGIGTSSPSEKLDVNGRIKAESSFIGGSALSGEVVSDLFNAQSTGPNLSDAPMGFRSRAGGVDSLIGYSFDANGFSGGEIKVAFHSKIRYSDLNRNSHILVGEDDRYNYFLDNGNPLIHILGNGDVRNENNSYGGTSDKRLKQDISDSSSQWQDIKNLEVKKFRFKKEVAIESDVPSYTAHPKLGVIAQDLEAAGMSGLVKEENGVKSVKYSVLYMKAVKALQEAMERIETLEAEVASLKNA